MQKVYARDAQGRERLLALVRKEGDRAFVCPIERFNPGNISASLDFAVGFPLNDVREASDKAKG